MMTTDGMIFIGAIVFVSIFVWLILERFARVRLTGDTTISRALGAVAERNDDNARNQVDE